MIGGAAARGDRLALQHATPLAAWLYQLMGGFAVVLTSITLVYGVLIARSDRAPRDPALRAGVVIGLVMTFVLTMVFAGYLGSNGSHFVGGGGSDAGGLALMGWARDGGDLRVPHFFGTHAMHVVPAAGFVAGRTLAPRPAVVATGAGGGRVRALLRRDLRPGAGRPAVPAARLRRAGSCPGHRPGRRWRRGGRAMLRRMLGLALVVALLAPPAARAQDGDCVVLLHGLGRSDASLLVMEEALAASGLRVVNLGYPSTEMTVEALLGYVTDAVEACGADRVNFVTHSMGGLLGAGLAGAEPARRHGAGGDAGAAEPGVGGGRRVRRARALSAPDRAGRDASSAPILAAWRRGCRRSTSSSGSSPATGR